MAKLPKGSFQSEESLVLVYGVDFTFYLARNGVKILDGSKLRQTSIRKDGGTDGITGISEYNISFSYQLVYNGNSEYSIEVQVLNPSITLKDKTFVD